MSVQFNATHIELKIIFDIVKRAQKLTPGSLDELSLSMDIEAVHSNGCKLDLSGLLNADDFNFLHDIYGIIRHIDRETGKLTNCFSPRFSI